MLRLSGSDLKIWLSGAIRSAWLALIESRAGRWLTPVNSALILFGLGTYPSRFVLTIGDDGATLVHIRSGKIEDALFVGPEAEGGPETLREYLEANPRSPVLVVADVLEQMFREDTIPKVSFFDRGQIVKRRTEMTFPNEVLRAAMPLPRKKGLRQQWVLFTALPTTPNLEKWIEFLESVANPVSGFALLPIEAVGLAGKLTPPTGADPRKVWRALVIQQASSGVRQVIEKDGRFIVTRLTEKPSDMSVESEAMLLERELRASLSYVKRQGYVESDRLDVVVLADPLVGRAISDRDLPATSVTVLTPYQAGYMAGLGDTGREDSPYSDVLMSLWMTARAEPKVILPSPKIRDRLQLERMIRWGTIGTTAVTLLALAYAASFVFDYFDAADTADALQVSVTRAASQLAAERARMDRYPIPFEKLRQIADVEQSLADRQIDPVGVLRTLAGTLTQSVRVDKLAYSTLGPHPAPNSGGQALPPPPPPGPVRGRPANAPPPGYQIDIVVRFLNDSQADPDSAVRDAKDYLNTLTSAFPGQSVSVVHLPVSLLSDQALEGSTGAGADKSTPITAEYVIRKGAGG